MKNIALLFLFITVNCFSQANLYVSLTGNDNSGNGSISNPYRTIEKAAEVAETFIVNNPTTSVTVNVRGGLYRNTGFTTFSELSVNSYDPENSGEPIWKVNSTTGSAVRLNNIDGNSNAWITIRPYEDEVVIIECDGDIAFNIRNCTYLKVEGFEIKGIAEKIPLELAWKYWGTYRYDNNGTWVYGDRKLDICAVYNLSNCTDIPPLTLQTDFTYQGLPNIEALNVQRPNLFDAKGMLVNLSHHIEVKNCNIHHFSGGGLRVTGSDYVAILDNEVHHNSNRASVGTHGLVIEGLTADSGVNNAVQKCIIANNKVYSNYNELYSWVQTKVICTTVIDEGKGIALLRSGSLNGFNGIIRVENNVCYDNGKSGIHTNDVDNAEIVNNTVYYNAHTNIYNAELSGGINCGISIQSSNNIKIINNIAVVPDGLVPNVKALSKGANCSGEVVLNNITFGGGTNSFPGGFTIANPQFTNTTNANFSIQSNSTAINSANVSYAPTTDYYHLMRDNLPDIGAFEYLGDNCNTSTTWNGMTWSNGLPTFLKSVILSADFTFTESIEACSLTINNNAQVLVTSGTSLVVNKNVMVQAGSNLTFQNNAHLIQFENTNNNSGTISLNRNSSALKRLDYTLWSSPVSNQNLLDFSPQTLDNRFYVYNTATNLYNSITPSTNSFQTAKGYLIRMPNDHPTTATIWQGNFTGIPNNGNITFTMNNGGNGFRFNAVGNPYPSPINATNFANANTNAITGTLYFWRKTNNDLSPSYCTWTKLGFVDNGEEQVFDLNGVIQTGQGFVVEAKNSATSLQFNNNMRVNNASNQFFRTSNLEATINRFWLKVNGENGSFSKLLIGYTENSTNDYDEGIDGKNINDDDVTLTSIINNEYFTIQGRALPFENSDVLPLNFRTYTAGNFTISLDTAEGIFNNEQELFLKDNLLQVVHDLSQFPYVFYSENGNFNARFEIVYQSTLLNNSEFTFDNIIMYPNPIGNNQDLFIKGLKNETTTISIFDVTGKEILNQKMLTDQLSISNVSKGMYLVKIETETKTVTKKLIIK